MRNEDEHLLLERIARKDGRALEALYDRYARLVYSLALGLVRNPQAAEEVTQEVFMAVWRGSNAFDSRRGAARTWVLSLAHHKSVDAVRRQRVRTAEPLSESMTVDLDVAGQAVRSVEGAQVREALNALSQPQREAITLAYYAGYTQQEIANRLRVPLGTVKTRIRDGMLRLRGQLGRHVTETDR
ncbi:MAG: sigma-70 family RNA polymerase sigma factor [Armatimonadota bacterium]